jgi:sulfatase maturation enzyme AslB (radical SAM superfamily)
MGVSWHTPTTVNGTIPDHVFRVYWDKEIMQGIEGVIFPCILLFKRRGKWGQVTNIGNNNLQDVTDIIHQLLHLSFLICTNFIETSDSTTITWKLQTKVGDSSKTLSPAE